MLNVGLLIVGFFMDIYSAIMVVVPLIIPLGALFGIDPVHMGIIFLANLELGFSHPPIGLNLFMASYRFKQPLTRIYWQVLPFLFVLLFTVLVITYVPQMSTLLIEPGRVVAIYGHRHDSSSHASIRGLPAFSGRGDLPGEDQDATRILFFAVFLQVALQLLKQFPGKGFSDIGVVSLDRFLLPECLPHLKGPRVFSVRF